MFEIPDLDAPGLRKFGFTMAAIIAGLFGAVLPLLKGSAFPLWPWIIAAVLAVWATAAPRSLRLIYRPWMKLGGVLGWINTRIILGIVFVLVVVPLGRLLQVIKERKVGRITDGIDKAADSYWTVPASRASNMEKPF